MLRYRVEYDIIDGCNYERYCGYTTTIESEKELTEKDIKAIIDEKLGCFMNEASIKNVEVEKV